MRRAHGYATIIDPERPIEEFDCRVCNHCQRIDHVKPGSDGTDLGALCNGCGALICKRCAAEAYRLGHCVTFREQLERSLAKQDALRSYGFG